MVVVWGGEGGMSKYGVWCNSSVCFLAIKLLQCGPDDQNMMTNQCCFSLDSVPTNATHHTSKSESFYFLTAYVYFHLLTWIRSLLSNVCGLFSL